MIPFLPERRRFLRILASLSAALSWGCASRGRLPTDLPTKQSPEGSLGKLVLAVGPWPPGEKEGADDFVRRFLAAEDARSSYLPASRMVLHTLAGRFPEGAYALGEIDLRALSPEERDLLTKLVEQLYNYIEVRFFVSREPPWGQCQPDRMRYTRPPD